MKKKVIILLVFFAVVAVASYFLLFKKKKSASIAGNTSDKTSKYEGNYYWFEGANNTIYVKDGVAIYWKDTGITTEEVIAKRILISKEEMKLIPQGYEVSTMSTPY
jgi:hypothetical protein